MQRLASHRCDLLYVWIIFFNVRFDTKAILNGWKDFRTIRRFQTAAYNPGFWTWQRIVNLTETQTLRSYILKHFKNVTLDFNANFFQKAE